MNVNAKRAHTHTLKYKRSTQTMGAKSERKQGGITVYPGVVQIQYGPLPVYGSVSEEESGSSEI